MSGWCLKEIFVCFLLSVLYVGSLYVWNATQGRDHPSTIKKRCISVFFMTIVSPLFVIWFGNQDYDEVSLWAQMGLRWEGLLPALVVPLFLTFILFLGPLVQSHLSVPVTATLRMYMDPLYWYNTAQNPIWWRNQLVAPFSEEFTFRACMLPILLQCLTPGKAIFVAPLFFGVAHLHHAVDRLNAGITLPAVILISSFQFLYTSVFGFYSAFLFIRTGHFLPLFAVHAFCNHIGVPEVKEMLKAPAPLRSKLMACHVLGLVAWYFLLYPLTEPSLYSNAALAL
ncbi:CAAX prenyl protease 2-like [Portunus trituberculatus]|uniref:CAAX prenyl protease 2-like n=1 Tax=Portunus trituberculatus TaxID=210409 RepID=UPI001E1CC4C9|nr:CAAX prenyl protease 2-like [Portunus trituberculatus]